MGEITIKKWKCDRCEVILDERPKRGVYGSRYHARASVDHGTSGGPMFDWEDMCGPCNSEVCKQLTEMSRSAEEARKASSKASLIDRIHALKGGKP